MKNKLLTIVILMLSLSFTSKGQNSEAPVFSTMSNEYPKLFTDSNGKQCIILTIQQAQKLDNDGDLLRFYRLLHANSVKYLENLVVLVGKDSVEIGGLYSKINELEKNETLLQKRVNVLDTALQKSKSSDSIAKASLELSKTEVKNLKHDVRKQKTMKVVGFGVGILGIIIAVIAIL